MYERLGVTEYFQYDPTGEYLRTQLKGARLSGGRYAEQAAGRSATGEPTLRSEALELDVFVNGEGDLRFRDPRTGEELPTYEQQAARAAQEAAARRSAEARAAQQAARADQETAARRAAEARIAEMERLLRERDG